jgi:hypothetical protein
VRCNVLEQISRLRQCFLKCVQPKDFFSFRNEVTSRKRARDGIKKGDVYETMEGESISQQSHSNLTAISQQERQNKKHMTQLTHLSFLFLFPSLSCINFALLLLLCSVAWAAGWWMRV